MGKIIEQLFAQPGIASMVHDKRIKEMLQAIKFQLFCYPWIGFLQIKYLGTQSVVNELI